MENCFSCSIQISQQQCHRFFALAYSFGVVRRQNTMETLSVYHPQQLLNNKQGAKQNINKKSSRRVFTNSLVALTSKNQTILLHTKQPLKKNQTLLPSLSQDKQPLNKDHDNDKNGNDLPAKNNQDTKFVTYYSRKIIYSSHFSIVDNNYLPIALKTSVFESLTEVTKLKIEVQNYTFGDHGEIMVYHFDKQEDKYLEAMKKQQRLTGDINQLKANKNIIVRFIDRNFCNEIREDRANKMALIKEVQILFDKVFGDFFDLIRGNKDFNRAKKLRQNQYKQDHFTNQINPFLKCLSFMAENNNTYAYQNLKINYELVSAAFLIHIALKPIQLYMEKSN